VPLDDPQAHIGWSSAAPRVVDYDSRTGRTPPAAGEPVQVTIGAQIEPRARPDLEKPYWKPKSVLQDQQRTDQRRRPADLVGLWWPVQGAAQQGDPLSRDVDDATP
jgi:hypothetical protein